MKDRNENRPRYNRIKDQRLTPLDVGDLPREWAAPLLNEVCSSITNGFVGQSLKHQVGDASGILYIQGFNVRPNRIELNNRTYVTPEFAAKHKKAKLHLNDIVTVQSGHIGTTAVITKEIAGSSCHALIISRPDQKQICSQFAAYYMNSSLGQRRMRGLHVGSTIMHINTSELAKYRLPLPPLPEQEKIAEVLGCWDKGIERLEDLIEQKRLRKKGLMQQLLTGKKRLPGFVDDWKEVRMKELFKEVKRPVKWSDNDTYSLISVRRRSGGAFLREQLKGSQILTKTMFTAHAGDFLISKMQVLHGAMAMVPKHLDGMHISGSYIAMQKKKEDSVDMEFFERLSQMKEFYHLTYLSSYGVHIEKMTFNFKWFMKSQITIPAKLEEQRAIAAVLRTADEEIELLEAELDALREQKKGLMQKLLTGEVRCPEFRAQC